MGQQQSGVGSFIERVLGSCGMLHFKDASARVRVADLVVKSQVVFSVRSPKNWRIG